VLVDEGVSFEVVEMIKSDRFLDALLRNLLLTPREMGSNVSVFRRGDSIDVEITYDKVPPVTEEDALPVLGVAFYKSLTELLGRQERTRREVVD